MPFRPTQITGNNAEKTKAHNRRVVLGYLRGRDAGRAEVARATGLSTQTVSNLVAELAREGLVAPQGRRAQARGQPPVVYGFNPTSAAILGFEVRPDALTMVLTDLGGKILTTGHTWLTQTDPAHVLGQMAMLAGQAATLAPRILGAGLVIPGPFGATGLNAASATALPDWVPSEIPALAESALALPVWLDKDATAAALAEGMFGAAKGAQTYAFLYFGAGLGLGIIDQGQPLRGAFGNAGELGHIVSHPNGLPCDCGNNGCLEQYVSRLAVQRHLIARGLLPADGHGTDAVLTALLARDDAALSAWVDTAAEALSRAIGMLENLFDPQYTILGGALPDALLDLLIARLALPPGSVAHQTGRDRPRVLRGTSGRLTAALGAAALVIHHTVTPRIAAYRIE
ncbi:ROK family transcriptional regulator [Pseudorhodobacter sp.]|uniref:ROK family transcriptional regulator n=1 Tax=Pseudorhodobacter sp. TaxID=1934400 RepID=UPI002648E92B|nr:ROK family transcriptional regulator [Pseudorhodobacter sp.]MDN5788829.1 ROK family transcriptional regulator [Pseudorhodobacter sp.]